MLDGFDLSGYVVTPLSEGEIADLVLQCDRPIPEAVLDLLRVVWAPQSVCNELPNDDDEFLRNQRGIPPGYCAFAFDHADASIFAVDAAGRLFRFDFC